MGFVPVQLNKPGPATWQADCCDALSFAPPARAVNLSQGRPDSDSRTCCNGLDMFDLINDLEFHSLILCERQSARKMELRRCLQVPPLPTHKRVIQGSHRGFQAGNRKLKQHDVNVRI